MDRRLKLDGELRDLQDEVLGYQHTYFEPPESIRMQYDAVVYKRQKMNVKRADGKSYLLRDCWEVTVISRDVETELPRRIQEHFARCDPGRPFVKDNLFQFPFTIYY